MWQGSHAAAHPVWASDQRFEAILTIVDPRFPDKKLAWLDDDPDVDNLTVEVEVRRSEGLVVPRRRAVIGGAAVVFLGLDSSD